MTCGYIVQIEITPNEEAIPSHQCPNAAAWTTTRRDGSQVFRCNQHVGMKNVKNKS